jgi:cytoskeletal protein CcmA (bactofilin family)
MPMSVAVQRPEPEIAEINTLLGKGSEFEGKLTFEGTVRIDGKLRGEIFTEDVLIVGEGAVVGAEIDVGILIVEGTVQGNVRAKRLVEIHSTARVRGNLVTPTLFIDKGAFFEGGCKMDGGEKPVREHAGASTQVTARDHPAIAIGGREPVPASVPQAPTPVAQVSRQVEPGKDGSKNGPRDTGKEGPKPR